jgi:hypothetical protein
VPRHEGATQLAGSPAAQPVRQSARLPLPWARLVAATSVLSVVGAVVALAAPGRAYAGDTAVLTDAATAQDIVGLLLGPAMVLLGRRARQGHLRSWLVLLGALSFTVYNYAIYAFSLSFGPLFLLWVAVWGTSVFALLGSAATLPLDEVSTRFTRAAVRLPGWFLVAAAVLFALLWLREIVPDLVAGRPSTSAAAWRVPTNPVHVLDLGVYLPAAATSGLFLLRRNRIGCASAVGLLVFLALTCGPILLTPLVTQARGHTTTWSILGPIGVVVVATLLVLARLLRSLRPTPERHP